MKLSTAPFRWISVALLLLVATAIGLLAASTFRPSVPTAARPAAPAGPERTRPRPAVLDEPRVPQVWVIAIGIDQYQDDAIPACHGAVHDARAVGRWFSKTAGWKPENVLLMDDLGEAEPGSASEPIEDLLPTRANLDWAFRLWLGARVRPDDRIVIFFAGQSIVLPPSPSPTSGDRSRTVLLPADADLSQRERAAWRLDEAIDPWASSGRNPIVCWLDTSTQGRGRKHTWRPDPGPASASDSLLSNLVRWPGVTAWLAAEGRPCTEASAVGAFSPFTGSLLAGLGTPERPAGLIACLSAMTREPALTRQGFRTLGGIDPNESLWSTRARSLGLARRELLLQRGHARGISALAFTADGDRMITGSQDSTIKVWRVSDRAVLRAHTSHLVGVTCLDLSPDGRRLASGDGSGRLRIRDLERDVEIPTGPLHERGVDVVAFLPAGETLVSLDLDGASWLWHADRPAVEVKPLSARSTGLSCARRHERFAFALAGTDAMIRLYGPGGEVLKTLDGPGGAVTSRRLALDGRRLAAADGDRRVILWDAGAEGVVYRATLDAPIDTLALSSNDRLAVASGRELVLLAIEPGSARVVDRLGLPEPANLVAFSNDGRWLAAGTLSGMLRVWSLTVEGTSAPIALEDVESGKTATLAFSPDGRRLVSGDQDGGLRTWDLPDGHQRPPVLPRRGQVAGLSVSEDGRYLLQISQDREAQLWDLQEGRGLSRIPGRWTSGVVARDGASLVLTSEDAGEVVVVDRVSGLPRALQFERPRAQGGAGVSTQPFAHASVSRDGRKVAAGSSEGPLACVWDAATGQLMATLRGHRDPHPITSVEFSTAADRLLTASEDGSAKLWELSDPAHPGPAHELAAFTLIDPTSPEAVPVSAAALSPGRSPRVVTGGLNGQVLLWEVGAARPLELGRMDYAVLATTFTPDGRWLAATGADKTIWLWDLAETPRRIRLEPTPNHAEQINALLAWPGGKVLASGSDDTTIRFWNLERRSLLGTISAEQGTTDWVAYTPDGLFDSSVGGERQVTWRDERGVLALEQVYDQFHVDKLTDQLRRGVSPKAPERPRRPPPLLSIDPPPAPVQVDRVASLTIALGEPGLTNLRLYQNGIPVQSADDFRPEPGQKRFTTQVRLRHGLNRFHVMAGRPDISDVEGRSEDVEVRCDGSDPPGRLHILALGVSKYSPLEHALQFADRDAKNLADFLHDCGVRAGVPGLKIVLTDREVNQEKVEEAFATIRELVKDRPEDTVVVFLAGHAETLNQRFVLLLSPFRFRKPIAGKRNPALGGPVDPESILTYVSLYRNIARLGALQRLVVIDACQAEAIGDDPGVRRIQEMIDVGSQKARTAYLLAARRGEPATEAAALRHGLMTYALLKGMGDTTLEPVPGLAVFDAMNHADRDGDHVITTEELRWFVSATIPALASQFPTLVQRAGADGPLPPLRPDANLGQDPRIQASDASFSLIAVPTETVLSEDGSRTSKSQ